MKWPNHTDYQDALQDPKLCFAGEDLKAGEAACDPMGLPRVMSGNFASVYEISTGGKRWAIRCFVRQVSGTQARYSRLSEHLESVKVPWLVDFDFIPNGIMVQGEWYPIVKMEWVEGCPLNTYIDQHIQEPQALLALAAQFRTLVSDLRRHKIAHGDFQHGNIMVTTAGQLRLVDYDGMYCPAFGKKRSPELGHANFQHPLRLADYYDESLDNFSALAIYTSLLALAAEPGLWKEFFTGDNLILSSADYRNVQGSKVFQRLKNSPNPEVPQLAALLQQCCVSPIAFIPWFEETLVALKDGTLRESIAVLESDSPDPGSEARPGGWWDNSQAKTAIGTRQAPTGSRPASAPPAPPASGSRPAAPPPVPRPAPPPQSSPATQTSGYTPQGTAPPPEPGVSMPIKIGIAALILIFIIGLMLSAARRRAAAPPPAAIEAR